MRMTIGSRLTFDNVPLPLVDSLVEETILGLVRIGAAGLAHPLCPLTEKRYICSTVMNLAFTHSVSEDFGR